MIEVPYTCPKVGRIFYQIDEETVVNYCWPCIVESLLADETTVTAIYSLVKAKREEDYILTPKE